MDCGPTCLRMVAKHYGRRYSMDSLRQKSGINREGVSLLGISEAAEEIGFRSIGVKLTWEQLRDEAKLPCIVFWNQVHFIVVYRIKKDKVYISDPAKGKTAFTKEEFLEGWLNSSGPQENGESWTGNDILSNLPSRQRSDSVLRGTGIALLLEP
ncbi:cysteine peptidase family C39 domain-containing protein [Rhodohalobacter sp. WB101]|uniref:Cysteine peptidase family C39 domain-containing protein n=1 Tax=Rhodohalobacter sulfatireducens TaxID=2911366 RepID=A0ABS9KBH8_9BACT|nr:cysteine peptidase family C39 domain-containing protein [Rhodohalobacter sulfatireducens]